MWWFFDASNTTHDIFKKVRTNIDFFRLKCYDYADMWELRATTSHGGFSVRRIVTFVLTILVTAFLWVLLTPSSSYAADASWQGSSISYEGNTYLGPADEATVRNLNLPQGTQAYTYVDPASSNDRRIRVIYFEPDVDTSVATGAKYRTYVYQGPSSFTNPSSVSNISIDEQSNALEGTSSCAVEGGMGWLICPATNTLASWMDWVFDVLASFLSVRPVQMGQDNALYRAWAHMRTLANIAFVIAFLIIIYSQITSIGLSNYSLKKLLPRLIIAAILVNVSYIICALAIDISNILGYAIQDMFIMMRNSLVGAEGNSWDVLSWESISSFVLSGGTLLTAGLIAGFTTISTYGIIGSLALLLPALVAGLLAVLIALLIMASRQAIITILTILAPLAFVAYLLPNTEKWFDKWRSTFMTMLILFPAFSVIFGGSQLAASVIIQNADSINLIILGMIVQVAPLFITPLLIKFSGSLLGRIAGIVNNPNRGLVDRTRNFTKDRVDARRARMLGDNRTPQSGARGAMRRRMQAHDNSRRRREGRKAAHTAMADAMWANSQAASDIDQVSREASDVKQIGEATSEQRYARSKLTNVEIQKLDIDVRNAKATLDNLGKEVDVQFKNLQTDASALNVIPAHLAAQALVARQEAQRSSVLDRQMHAAEHMRQDQFAEAMVASEVLQRQAGGIDPNGAQAALANAVNTMRSSYNKNVEEGRAIIKHFNLSGQQRQDHAMGREFTATDAHGNSRTFRASDVFTREAAIEDQLSGQGTVENATEIIAASGGTLREFRTTISATMASSGFGSKTIWGGGKTIDDVAQGKIKSMDDVKRVVAETIAKGKVSAADLARADKDALAIFSQITDDLVAAKARITDPALRDAFDSNIIRLSETAKETLTGDERVNVKSNAREHILKIAQTNDPTFNL